MSRRFKVSQSCAIACFLLKWIYEQQLELLSVYFVAVDIGQQSEQKIDNSNILCDFLFIFCKADLGSAAQIEDFECEISYFYPFILQSSSICTEDV